MKNLIAIAIFTSFFLSACTTVFVGGDFGTYGGQNAFRLLSIGKQGDKNTWFAPGGSIQNGTAFTSAVNSKGTRIYIGGSFSQYDGLAAGRIVVIDYFTGKNMEGIEFNSGTGFDDTVHVIARDLHFPDRFIVGGEFTTYKGLPAPGIIRLMANGDIDPDFDPGTGFDYSPSPNNARIVTVAFDLTNKRTCLGGSFTSYAGEPANNMICVLHNGRPISSYNQDESGFTFLPWSGSYEGAVEHIEFDENYDKIYVGGRFNHYNGIAVDHLVRLGTNGNFEFNYQLQTQGTKRALFLLTGTNAIITGGKSYTIDTGNGPETTIYNSLIKINRDDGKLVPGFAVTPSTASDYQNTGAGLGISASALVDGEAISPGKLYFSGVPTSIVGTQLPLTYYNLKMQRRLLRIDKTTGTIDGDFNFSADFGYENPIISAAKVNTVKVIYTPLF